MSIRLIIGLGNPGSKYEKTRHNAGFWLLDNYFNLNYKLEKKFLSEVAYKNDMYFIKPQTFMNLSGESVQKVMKFYKITEKEILIAHDELDFAPGVARFKQGGGHGGHNGLRDIISKINTKDFLRLRVGIGRPDSSDQVSNYVLKSPSKKEKIEIDAALLRSYHAFEYLIDGELEKAIQYLHT